MYNKKKKNFNRRKKKKILKPRYKVTFISLDDPRVYKEVERLAYEKYLRELKKESGDEDE